VTVPGGDPFARLGLDPAVADAAAVRAARRRLATTLHPDLIGGDGSAMRDLNAAAAAALAALAAGVRPAPASDVPARSQQRPAQADTGAGMRRDHPSFTVEVLPAEAFEALVVVASWFGEVADDSPPYALEVLLGDPVPSWCRLHLVPDAGSTTVSIDVAPRSEGVEVPSVEAVRDLWVAALNRLDWSTIA
jgi:hypothetical protein